MNDTHSITTRIRSLLKASANNENAVAMQKYMKSEMPFRGVKSASNKEIVRIAINENPITSFDQYNEVITELWKAEYREERYAAIALARRYERFQTLESLPIYRMMIETGAWWDYVDGIACNLIGNLLRKYPLQMKSILHEWIMDSDLWIRRSAILSQNRFKSETDHQMLFHFCKICLHEKSFWIRKAIGWALRDYSKSEPDRVRDFVQSNSNKMSGLSKREASKYI